MTKDINEMRRYAENLEKVFQVQTKLAEMVFLSPIFFLLCSLASRIIYASNIFQTGGDDLPDLVEPHRVYGILTLHCLI